MGFRNVRIMAVVVAGIVMTSSIYALGNDNNALNPYHIVIDNTYAKYPKYRIDKVIKKISIYGSSHDKESATQALSMFISSNTNIKVISPRNIDSILKGKIFEFGAGLNPDDAKLLAQMVQVDHVLVFDESIAKHEEYANGGQAYIDFKIQIIRTSDGELVYQDMQRYGAFYPYNTQIIYPSLNQSDINALRGLNFKQLFFKFGLALGMTRSGIIFKGKTKDVGMVLMGSPAHKAGIAAGDTITRVNGRSIKNIYDMDSFQKEFKIKQGDKIRVGYLREGIAREAVMEFPKILSYSVEKRKVIPKETTPAKKKMWDI